MSTSTSFKLASASRHNEPARDIASALRSFSACSITLDFLGEAVTTDQPLSADQHAEAEAIERLSEAGFQCTNLSDDPNSPIPASLVFQRTRPNLVDMTWLALDVGKLSTAARYNPAAAPTTADESGGEMLPTLRQVTPAPLIDVVTEVLTWPEAESP